MALAVARAEETPSATQAPLHAREYTVPLRVQATHDIRQIREVGEGRVRGWMPGGEW